MQFAKKSLEVSVQAAAIFSSIMGSEDDCQKVQTLLDPTTIPAIISAKETEPDILQLFLSVTTTWCYSMNRTRLKLLGK